MVYEKIMETINENIIRIILIAGILIITFITVKIARLLIHKAVEKSSRFMKVDHTKYTFLKHLISAAIYLLGIGVAIYFIPVLRTMAVSMLAGAGIMAVVIGFAAQDALSNIISGVMLIIFKPFSVGDRITIGPNLRGIVEDISLRHTIIRNFENKRIIVPNKTINSETIENATITDEKICKWIDFGISYDSDIKKAKKIMAEEAIKHPNHIDNRTTDEKEENKPIITVRVTGFGDSSVNLRAYVWCQNAASAFTLACDLNESIKKRFDKEGIEIPFPYRTIVFKNKEEQKRKKITKIKNKKNYK